MNAVTGMFFGSDVPTRLSHSLGLSIICSKHNPLLFQWVCWGTRKLRLGVWEEGRWQGRKRRVWIGEGGLWRIKQKECLNREHQGGTRKWERFSSKNGRALRQSLRAFTGWRVCSLPERCSWREAYTPEIRLGDCLPAFLQFWGCNPGDQLGLWGWLGGGTAYWGTGCIYKTSVASGTTNIFWCEAELRRSQETSSTLLNFSYTSVRHWCPQKMVSPIERSSNKSVTDERITSLARWSPPPPVKDFLISGLFCKIYGVVTIIYMFLNAFDDFTVFMG